MAALSDGGDVQMPLEETFWAHRWGSFTDRFGKRFANENVQALLMHNFYFDLLQFDPQRGRGGSGLGEVQLEE